jgi:hypothetical protein
MNDTVTFVDILLMMFSFRLASPDDFLVPSREVQPLKGWTFQYPGTGACLNRQQCDPISMTVQRNCVQLAVSEPKAAKSVAVL